MNIKKIIVFALIAVSVFGLVACSPKAPDTQGNPADGYPARPIELIVSFSAGGGTDVGARLLTPLVEAELGQPFTVVNITGAGGWVGWTELSKARPDGYKIGYINTPPFITGYLNPDMGRPAGLDLFIPVANHVWDATVWAVRPDFHLQTVEDILEYAKNNPGQISMATTGVYTQHHINALVLKQKGYELDVVHTQGASDAATMALGGHIDILSAGVGEVKTLARDGKLKVVAVMDTKRTNHLPDVPTFVEATGIELVSFSSRGIAAPKGTPKEIVDKLAAAFEKAINDPEHIKKMADLGLDVRFMGPEEYVKFLQEYEKTLKELLGW